MTMSNLKKFILVLMMSALFRGEATAMMMDMNPSTPGPSPQANLTGTPSELSLLTSAIKEINKNRQTLKSMTDMTRIKQLAKSYASKLGNTALNMLKGQNFQKNKKVITYSRTIEDCKEYKVTDENGSMQLVKANNPYLVKKAFVNLFFQYPDKNNQAKYAYEQKGEQLKMDTTIEMFITAKELQKKLVGREIELFGAPIVFPDKDHSEDVSDIEEKLSSASMEDLGLVTQLRLYERCLVGDQFCDIIGVTSCVGKGDSGGDRGGQVQSGGGNNNEDMACFWNSAIKAEKLYDTIMLYNEMLVAMLAQYRSVMGISSIAKIREYKSEEENNNDQTSALEAPYHQNNIVVSQKITADAMFADMTAADRFAERMDKKYKDMMKDPAKNTGGDFERANGATGYSHILESRMENFADLESLAAAEEYVQKAETIHSALQRLPTYEDIYKQHEYIKRMHEISRQMVMYSSECAMRMLEPYYESPEEAMFGANDCYVAHNDEGEPNGKIVCHTINHKAFEHPKTSLEEVACRDSSSGTCYMADIDEYIDSLSEEDLDENGEEKPLEKPVLVEAPSKGGIMQYLIDLYRVAIDGNAVYEYDKDVNVTVESANETESADYSSHLNIKSDVENPELDEGKNRGAKYMNMYEVPEDENNPDGGVPPTNYDEPEDSSTVFVTERDDDEVTDKDGFNDKRKDMAENPGDYERDPSDRSSQPRAQDDAAADGLTNDTQVENLLRWTIGKEIMSDIALDLPCGLNTAGGECYHDPIHFAEPKAKFIVWKDQREFYDQYIDGKYENIKQYIETAPAIILLLNVAESLGIDAGIANKILDFYEEDETGKIEAVLQEQDERFKKVDEDYLDKIKPLNEEREELVTRKDELGKELNKQNGIFNQARRELKGAELAKSNSDHGNEFNRNMYEQAGRTDVDVDAMPQTRQYTELTANAEARREEAERQKTRSKERAEEIERELEDIEDRLEEIDDELVILRQRYVKDLSDAEYIDMTKSEDLTSGMLSARSDFNPTTLTIAGEEIEMPVVPLATELMSCVRDKMLDIIKKHEEKYLETMRGYMYSINNYVKPNLNPIKSPLVYHQELMKKLTNLTAADLAGCPGVDVFAGVTGGINFFAHTCGDDGEKCLKAPVELDLENNAQESCNNIMEPDMNGEGYLNRDNLAYFVGMIGQPKDLLAPYPPGCPIGDEGIPLRETVHFNSDDYSSISKYFQRRGPFGLKQGDEDDAEENTDMYISLRLLLKELLSETPGMQITSTDNYIGGVEGAKTSIMPYFWKWILSPRTYIQRKFDLRKLIGVQNGTSEERVVAKRTQQELRRSGMYPCRSYEYDMEGKPTHRVFYDKYGVSTGVEVQYFVDLDRELHFSIPQMPPEKYTRENPYIIGRMSQHPEWLLYTSVPYNSEHPEETPIPEVIRGVRECLAVQARVEDPETGEGLRVFDLETEADMDNHTYDYVGPGEGGYAGSELGQIFTYYRNNGDKIMVKEHNETACEAICGSSSICRSMVPECQDEVLNDPLRLTFNAMLIKSFFTNYEDYGREGHEEETSWQNNATRVALDKNQFGDFLDQVESMRVTADNLLNSEKKMSSVQHDLEESLNIQEDDQLANASGEQEDSPDRFVFGPDFKLINDPENENDDYDRLRRALIERKMYYLDSALSILQDLQFTQTYTTEDGSTVSGDAVETIKRRFLDILRRITLYKIDSENCGGYADCGIEDYPGDLVTIGGDEIEADENGEFHLEGSEMLEKMKQAKADWDIIVETAAEQDAEREKRLRKFVRPYCTSYWRVF